MGVRVGHRTELTLSHGIRFDSHSYMYGVWKKKCGWGQLLFDCFAWKLLDTCNIWETMMFTVWLVFTEKAKEIFLSKDSSPKTPLNRIFMRANDRSEQQGLGCIACQGRETNVQCTVKAVQNHLWVAKSSAVCAFLGRFKDTVSLCNMGSSSLSENNNYKLIILISK